MRVYQRHLSGDSNLLEGAHSIRIETDSGMVLSISELKDGTLSVSETTVLHLTVLPRAANAIILAPLMPETFSMGG